MSIFIDEEYNVIRNSVRDLITEEIKEKEK